MIEIIKEETVFNDSLKIEKAQIRKGNESYTRSRVQRPDGAAVLVYNTEKDTVILTKQFRYAVADKSPTYLLEILAGKVDGDEDPFETAVRETKEEIGYTLRRQQIKKIAACFVSPGYTSELQHIFYAEVKNADKTQEGGGLATENEDIEVVEIKSEDFIKLTREMQLNDSKTLLAGLWFAQKISPFSF